MPISLTNHSAAGAPLTPAEVQTLDAQFNRSDPGDVLAWASQRFGQRAALGTSFQGAGLVILHLARQRGLRFPVFTLDTGLLFPETLELKKRLEGFFGCSIESVVPEVSLEDQAELQGPELWKRDPDFCCTIRKVFPLQNKLAGLDCWITGLRRQQSETRSQIGLIELYAIDPANGRDIVKLNPLANWSREAVWDYIKRHQIPYNPLHDRGYRSIGCWPCTKQSRNGSDERAGRWVGFNKVECGIHTFLPKKVNFEI